MKELDDPTQCACKVWRMWGTRSLSLPLWKRIFDFFVRLSSHEAHLHDTLDERLKSPGRSDQIWRFHMSARGTQMGPKR